MQTEDYLKCAQYEGRAATLQNGFTAFFDEGTQLHYFAMLDADDKVLLKSEGYTTDKARDNGIESVIRNRTDATRYSVQQGASGRYHLCLKAANHQEIARSCSFETESGALALIPYTTMQSLRRAEASSARSIDEYMPCDDYKDYARDAEHPEFTTFQHANGNYYFAALDNDGDVLLKSESYPNAAVRDNGMRSVIKNRTDRSRYKVVDCGAGKYRLSLRAGNHQEIAVSCCVEGVAGAEALLAFASGEAQRGTLANARHIDEYLPCDDYRDRRPINADGFACFEHRGSHYFAMFDGEENLVFRSESYPNATVRDKGMDSVIRNRNNADRYKVIEVGGQHFVSLRAGNHQEIARSCPKDAASAESLSLNLPAYVYGSVLSAGIVPLQQPDIDLSRAAIDLSVAAPLVAIEKATEIEATPVVTPAPIAVPTKEKDDDYLHCDEYRNRNINDKQNNVALFKHSNGLYYFALYNAEGKVKIRSEGFESAKTRDEELSGVLRCHNDDSMYTIIERAGYRIYVLKDKTGREVGRSCAEPIVAVAALAAAPVEKGVDLGAAALVGGAALVGAALSGISLPEAEVEAAAIVPPVVVAADIEPIVAAVAAPEFVAPVAVAGAGMAGAAAPLAAALPWSWLALAAVSGLGLLTFLLMRGCNPAPVAVADTEIIAPVDTVVATAVVPPPVVAEAAVAEKTATTVGGVVLKNIFFNFDKSDIRPDANTELDKLIKVMNGNATYQVELLAHCDAKGDVKYNNALSARRATAAKAYLVAKGIDAKRISTKTFGKGAPIARNTLKGGADTEEGRQLNRRVEFRVLDASGKLLNAMVEKIAVPENLK